MSSRRPSHVGHFATQANVGSLQLAVFTASMHGLMSQFVPHAAVHAFCTSPTLQLLTPHPFVARSQ